MSQTKLGQLVKYLLNNKVILAVYVIAALGCAIKQYLHGSFNNYLIFKYVFWHTWHQEPLYVASRFYVDSNHYGPFFSIIIAPFAILPDWLGTSLWNLFNVVILLFGIFKLPISLRARQLIAWVSLNECITSLLSFQFNVAITGTILLTFVYMEKQKSFKAAIAFAIGFLVKLYGIVGLAFFLFNKRKFQFLSYLLVAVIVGFFLPAIIANPSFVIKGYSDWFHSLMEKTASNEVNVMADISLAGFIRKTTGYSLNVLYGCAFGGVLLSIALSRRKLYDNLNYKLLILAYVLLCLVLFNTNVESPTFIIAFVGVAIWYIAVPHEGYVHGLLIFAMLLTSLSPTDIFPRFIRQQYIIPYALKVVPCIAIWIDITWRLLIHQFNTSKGTISINE